MSNLLICDVPFSVEPVTGHIICSGTTTNIINTQLSYDDFQMLAGGILGMFILAYSLQQIRKVILPR